jgi:hypothetical protein
LVLFGSALFGSALFGSALFGSVLFGSAWWLTQEELTGPSAAPADCGAQATRDIRFS